MKTVLVTGSEGSLAQWVIKYLIPNYNIIGIDNFCRYGEIKRDREYKFIKGDLCDIEVVNNVFDDNKIDYVFHAAARIYGVKGFHKYPADILGFDSQITQNLLQASLNNNIEKFVYTSSSMVYERTETVPCVEDDIKDMMVPFTDYGLSKLVGERLVQAYSKQYGMKYVVWRPFNIITPLEKGEKESGISHCFADFIRKIMINKDKEIEIFGDGEQTRCFTWIDDIAKTIANTSFESITDNKEYNLGNEIPTKIIDLAKMIFEKTRPGEEFIPKFIEIYSDDVKIRVPDCTKAKEELNWKLTKPLEDIVDLCIENAKEMDYE